MAERGRPVPEGEWERTLAALEANNWNQSAAARELGKSVQTINSRVISARARGLIKDGGMLDGYVVKGTSTLYDADGNPSLTWVKTDIDRERQEQMIRETIAALAETIKPAKPVKAPAVVSDDIAVAYCIGDAHVGMYAWGAEAGEDFDCDIAEADLIDAAHRLVAASPQSGEAMIAQLGDFYHIDDAKNQTPAHHNILDVDTRFARVIRTGIKIMRTMIDLALTKHKSVRVRNVAGNHDPHASITLTEALRGYYINEPRVIIEDSPRPFFVWRFGSNLVGMTHGHTIKPEKMPGVLAVDGREHWSATEFKYIWHGHIHQKRMFEEMGVLVESFRTLAARDAFAAEHGYRPGRELQAIVLHKDYGEIERHTAGIKRVRHG